MQKFLAATLLIVTCSSCYMIRAYKFRKFKLTDNQKLPSHPVNASTAPFHYPIGQTTTYASWLDTTLANTHTAAFLIIRNDSIIYEKYFDQYNERTQLPSFSVVKSFVSTLVGIAFEEGKITSLQDPITKYIPELLKSDKRFANITIQHLLDMRSGIKWNEDNYGLKDDAVKLAFRPNMFKYIKKIKIETDPSQDSTYKSINTMLLGIAVRKATGKDLSAYLQEKIWQPAGMEFNAIFNTDKHGLEIAYGGLNAAAKDYAKLGTIFLHGGKINGRQIVSEDWVRNSVSPDSMLAKGGYHNQWWSMPAYKNFSDSADAVRYNNEHPPLQKVSSYRYQGKKYYFVKQLSHRFYAEGILGQFVYVNPEKKLVMVRLGHYWQHPKMYITKLFEHLENVL